MPPPSSHSHATTSSLLHRGHSSAQSDLLAADTQLGAMGVGSWQEQFQVPLVSGGGGDRSSPMPQPVPRHQRHQSYQVPRQRSPTLHPDHGLRIRVFEVPSPVFSASEGEGGPSLPTNNDGTHGVTVLDITLEQLLANVADGVDITEGVPRPSTPMNTPRAARAAEPSPMAPSSPSAFSRPTSTRDSPSPVMQSMPAPPSRSSSSAGMPRAPRLATGARMWVQISGLSLTEGSIAALTALGQAYKIHPVTVADLHSPDTREKLEMFGEYLFLVVHAIVHPTPTIFDIMHAESQGLSRNSFDPYDDSPGVSVAEHEDDDRGSMNPNPKPHGGGVFRAARVRTTPIQLVVFPHLVLSFHYGQQQSELNSVCRKLHSLSETRMDSGQWIVHAILDTIVSSLRPIVDETDAEVERIEELIFHPQRGSDTSGSLLKRLGLTRRRLLMLQQQLKSKQGIINSLIGRESTASSSNRLSSVQTPYLRDLYDHVFTMLVSIEGDSTMLEALQNTYLSQLQLRAEAASWEMNRSMKKFSAFATIILPLSLISGIMGMNVEVPSQVWERAEDGPSLDSMSAFWTIILVMITIAGIITIWMKRSGHLS